MPNFCCSRSNHIGVRGESHKFLRRWGWPIKTPLPTCYHAKFGCSGSNGTTVVVVVVVVVAAVEIFVHGAVKATVTNAPQSQLNKWVFSSFLNWPTVVSDWRSEAGRLFQSLGPATWKATWKEHVAPVPACWLFKTSPTSWPLTFWPWKWSPSHVWRGLPLCQF